MGQSERIDGESIAAGRHTHVVGNERYRHAGGCARAPSELELIDGKDCPVRYTFSYKGAFFLCFSVSGADGADEATLRWLKATLEKPKYTIPGL